MLYQSLKQSIADYKEKKKINEKVDDKLIFRWKLITLGLSIILIILIGGLSQLYKAISDLKIHDTDITFLPQLLSLTTILDSRDQMRLFIQGIGLTNPLNFNKCVSLYQRDVVSATEITTAIEGKQNLVYIFESKDQQQLFGVFIQKAYSRSSKRIVQNQQLRYASLFSLSAELSRLKYKEPSDCSVYNSKDGTTDLTLMESLLLSDANGSEIEVGVVPKKDSCFGSANPQSSMKTLHSIIGITTDENPFAFQVGKVEIFQLSLDEAA